jgi:hypothetical protein
MPCNLHAASCNSNPGYIAMLDLIMALPAQI